MAAINIQRTLENPRYRNWVKASLSLKVTRDGIQRFVDEQVKIIHQQILANSCRTKGLAVGTVCNTCTTQNILPCPTKGVCSIRKGMCNNYHDNSDPLKKQRPCPTGICDDIYDQIQKSHRFSGPSWHNTDAQHWCSNRWEVAKCFFPTSGYKDVTSAVDTDLTGLLSVVINLNDFQNTVAEDLSKPNNIFNQVRNLRNQIMHTSTFELNVPELDGYIDTMIQLLSDRIHLTRDVNAQKAITTLNQIKADWLTVTAEDETKMRKEALDAIDEKKTEALDAIGEKKTEALEVIAEKAEHIDVKTKEALDAIGEKVEDIDVKTKEALDVIGENAGHIDVKTTEALNAIDEKAGHIDVKTKEALDAIGEKAGNIDVKSKEALDAIGEKAEYIDVKTKEVLYAIGEKDGHIDEKIKEAVDSIGEKAGHIDVKTKEALYDIGEKAGHIDVKTKLTLDAIGEKARHIDVKTKEALDAIGEQAGHNDVKTTEALDAIAEKAGHIDVKTKEALYAIGEKVEHIDVKTQEALYAIEEKARHILEVIEEKIVHIDVKKREVLEAIGKAIESIQSTQKQKTYMNDKKGIQAELIQLYRAKYIATSIFPEAPEEEDTDIDDIYVEPSMKLIDLQQKRRESNCQPLQQKSKEGNSPDKTFQSLEGLFYKSSSQCKSIYVTGDAGAGKTTLCKRIISAWCSAHSVSAMPDTLSNDEKTMLNFHLLFYISLRDVASDGDVENMITSQLLLNPCHKNLLSTILLDEPEKCLIILDGLDEWTPPEGHHERLPYVSKGLPSRTIANKCSILTTTRPWKLEHLRLRTSETDQQIELLGLNDDASKKLIDLVVANLNTRDEHMRDGKDFEKELTNKNLWHLTTIPLILNQLVCLWHEGKLFGESQGAIYTGIINFLFERVEKRPTKIPELDKIKENVTKLQRPLPKCFDDATKCQKFCSLLYSLSKLAFETLFSQNTESSLVFESKTAEIHGLSETEIAVCLNVGILSQRKVISGCTRKKSLSFLHKTFQEFLASVFVSMSSDQCELVKTISNICNSVDKVLEMSNMLVFISGMSPEMACKLSEHIWKVASDVTKGYRQTMEQFTFSRVIAMIHDNMMHCVKESSDNGYQNIKLKLEDIIIDMGTSDMDVKHLIHLIRTNIGTIKSVYIDTSDKKILSELTEILTQTDSLDMLCIYVFDYSLTQTMVNNSRDTLITLQLSNIDTCNMSELICILNKLNNLKNLSLLYITLTGRDHADLVAYVSHATQLQDIHMAGIMCSYKRKIGNYVQKHASLDLLNHKKLQYLRLRDMPDLVIVSVNTTQLRECDISSDMFPSLAEDLKTAPNLQVITIDNVGYTSSSREIDSLVENLPNLVHLKEINLNDIEFGERKLQLSHKMKNLESVVITVCTMTSEAVCSFVDSIPETQDSVNVEFDSLSIKPAGEADTSVDYIKACPRFEIKYSATFVKADHARIYVEFHTVIDRVQSG